MNYMCKDRKKLSNTEQKITKCNKKSVSRGTSQAFHVEHRKCFTWNIVSVSRGTSQAFHVEHQRRTGEDGKRGFASSSSLFGLACSAVGGGVRLRFCPLPCSACWPLSASLLALPCSGGGFYRGRFCYALKPPLLKTRSPSLRSGGQSLAF